MRTILEVAVLVLTFLGAVGTGIFLVAYQVKTRGAWAGSDEGRFLMGDRAVLFSLFVLILANNFFGLGWPGRVPITVFLYTAYCAFAWWPLRLLYTARKKDG